MRNKKITLLNVTTSIILQFVTIISGFIIPKIILVYFGSEVNGLVSSLQQFLNYISLLEGGVTGVIMANLYKPLVNNDNEKLSSVVKTTQNFYKKISIIFIIYSIGFSIIYPIVFKVGFSYLYVVSLSLILSISLFIQYNFSLTLKSLLNADKKNYIVSITQIIIIILTIILAYLSVIIYPSIHILKLVTGVLFILQPLIYGYYVKKHYKLNKNVKADDKLLKSRWDGFAVNIAYFIHSNTDIVILTMFMSLETVSIYSVYLLVVNGLKAIISAISSAIAPIIGHSYAKGDENDINRKMDLYEYIIFVLSFLVFTVAILLITPFVMIYTKGIGDANYYKPIFGVLIVIAEFIYVIKFPHLELAYCSNKFKEISKACFIEAGLNIIISILLIKKYGIIGVAVGTLIAMTYRMIYQVWYTNHSIIKRSLRKFYGKLISFSFSTLVAISICIKFIPSVEYTLISWILHAIIFTIILLIIYMINSIIFYKEELMEIKKYFKV